MMRRLMLVAGLAIAALVASTSLQSEAAQGSPRLRIVAQGATLEFRTLGLKQTGFTLASGSSKSWVLKPGRYVVVQAPPWGGGLQIACSDGVSSNEYILEAGGNLTCTFTATP